MKQYLKSRNNFQIYTLIVLLLLSILFPFKKVKAQTFNINARNTYIIKFSGESIINSFRNTENENLKDDLTSKIIDIQHDNFLEKFVSIKNDTDQMVFEYKNVFNGVSVKTDYETIKTLQEDVDIESIYLASEYALQRSISIPKIKAPEAWEINGQNGKIYKGKNILVGVIDTGVDFKHGELGGGIGKTWNNNWYKIKGGYDFSIMNNIPYEPYLSNHGTHVAGIIAGNGEPGFVAGSSNGSGVAPEASLMIYKVFSNSEKNTGDAAIIMALEQAVIDKCDVVNLSLGKNYGWSSEPLAEACNAVAKSGVIVVCSAGNSGNRNENLNRFPIHSPGSGSDSISVASSDATLKDGFYFKAEDEKLHFAIGEWITKKRITTEEEIQLIPMLEEGTESNFRDKKYDNKSVIVYKSNLTLNDLNKNAQNSNIKSIIHVNNKEYPSNSYIDERESCVPIISVSKSTGLYIVDSCNNNREIFVSYSSNDQKTVMSSFSSQGPTPDFNLKPEITAPGYRIVSSICNNQYTAMSGTSMSSPFVAGGAALLKELHPDWSVRDIKSLLVNYSSVIKNPLTLKPYSIYKQGSGQINLENSFKGTLIASPTTISFNQVTQPKTKRKFVITNKGKTDEYVLIECSSAVKQNLSVTVSPYECSIKPGGSVEIELTLEINEKTIKEFGEFWINITHNGKKDFHIPSIFYNGEYPDMPVILASYMFPTLAISPNSDGNADSNNFYCLSPYNIDGIEIDLFDSESNYIGNLFYFRNLIGAGYFKAEFTGRVKGKLLKDGLYEIKPYVLPLGKDYKKVKNWVEGKSSRALIDTIPPTIEATFSNIDSKTIRVTGSITDENKSLGLFLFYELDYDEAALITVDKNGKFDGKIYLDQEYCSIRLTAQDLAGNTTWIKKRFPLP
ncbi:MAG: S8 family serine peptidase [Caldisericia bacterium]|nr:S8 family serine peptidase [Caldisericia bacterium]